MVLILTLENSIFCSVLSYKDHFLFFISCKVGKKYIPLLSYYNCNGNCVSVIKQVMFVFLFFQIEKMDMLFEAQFSPLADSGRALSKCGKCLRYMKHISTRPPRLYCNTCEDVYDLPQNGTIKVGPHFPLSHQFSNFHGLNRKQGRWVYSLNWHIALLALNHTFMTLTQFAWHCNSWASWMFIPTNTELPCVKQYFKNAFF